MSAITIGIQTIMPKTGTSPQETPPPPEQESRGYSDNDALVAEAVAKQAPPPDGMGKLVDKTA